MKKFRLPRKYLILSVIILSLLGIFLYRRVTNRPSYQEYTVEPKDLRETLELSGEVTAEKSAILRFSAGGLVTYLGAQEGDTVKKWQTLASLDTRQLKKTLEQKLNLYAIERGEFDQGQDDHEKKIKDGDVDKELRRLLEKNQYQLDNTVKDVEYQDLSLKLSRIYSPIEGILIASPLTVPNVQVTATDTWTVVDPRSLQFVADLDETDLARVEKGQKVKILLDAFAADTLESTVDSVSFAPKETTTGTTYQVKIKIPVPSLTRLRLGMNGTARIILMHKDKVATVPSQTLTYRGGKSYVLVKAGNEYQEKEVETGIEEGGHIEIKAGLGVGDHVYSQED